MKDTLYVCICLFGQLPSDIVNNQHAKSPLLLLALLLFGQLRRDLLDFVQLMFQLPEILHCASLVTLTLKLCCPFASVWQAAF